MAISTPCVHSSTALTSSNMATTSTWVRKSCNKPNHHHSGHHFPHLLPQYHLSLHKGFGNLQKHNTVLLKLVMVNMFMRLRQAFFKKLLNALICGHQRVSTNRGVCWAQSRCFGRLWLHHHQLSNTHSSTFSWYTIIAKTVKTIPEIRTSVFTYTTIEQCFGLRRDSKIYNFYLGWCSINCLHYSYKLCLKR